MAEIFTRFKNHDISLTRDGDDKNWYIRVRGPDGLHAYDGYWRDSATKTAKEALLEAKQGAMLLPASPSMDPQRKRELAAAGVRVGAPFVLAHPENWPNRTFDIGDEVLIPGGKRGVVKAIDPTRLKRYHVMTSETQGGMWGGFELEPSDGVIVDAQPRHDDGSPAPEDTIAKCKRILAAVDAYHEQPTQATRSDLRHAIHDELERAARGVIVDAPLTIERVNANMQAAIDASLSRQQRGLEAPAICTFPDCKCMEPWPCKTCGGGIPGCDGGPNCGSDHK